VKGNVYRTRIYPLPPGPPARCGALCDDLATDAKGDAALQLPLRARRRLAHPRVEVVRGTVRPEIGGFGNCASRLQDTWVARLPARHEAGCRPLGVVPSAATLAR
jgi:hypothetical protein